MSQTSFRGQKNTEKSGVRLNFYASSVLHSTSARSKTGSSPEYLTSENQFSEVFHSEFSVLFHTQNRKLGVENLGVFSKVYQNNDFFLLNCVTSRILIKLRVFFQLRGFVFALYPKPKTRRWKTSEFDLIITVECSAKWKTRSWKTSEVDQSTSEKIREIFISEFSVLAMVQNGKIFSEVSEISENSEFSALPSEFRSLWIELSVVLCLFDRKVRLMVNDLFYSPGSQ